MFAPHTSLDAVPGGMTDWLASPFKVSSQSAPGRLSLWTTDPCSKHRGLTSVISSSQPFASSKPCELEPNPPAGFEGAGSGRIVELEGEGLELDEVVNRVKKLLGMDLGKSRVPFRAYLVCIRCAY